MLNNEIHPLKKWLGTYKDVCDWTDTFHCTVVLVIFGVVWPTTEMYRSTAWDRRKEKEETLETIGENKKV